MIRLLKGTVLWQNDTHILIDVHDVGYYVHASRDVHTHINTIGEKITIFTYTHVREDLLELYGFNSIEDLQLFEQCISVSGIGPKTAMGIFLMGNRDKIIRALLSEDVAFFSSVPRLGKKNAQKLIIELKSKVGGFDDITHMQGNTSDRVAVTDALKGFGFSQGEIAEALRSMDDTNMDVSEKVKLALRYLGK